MSLSFGSVYWKVWHALGVLGRDPDHQVADMVLQLTHQIRQKAGAPAPAQCLTLLGPARRCGHG